MIQKAALLTFRLRGRKKELLFLKPKGKPLYVFPGGKQEPGETIDQALVREMQEELGVTISGVQAFDVVVGQTPDGRDLTMNLFIGDMVGTAHAQAEIEAMIWLSRDDLPAHTDQLTPITANKILPLLAAKQLW
jgi:8-oxo-dGTP diphosphatase